MKLHEIIEANECAKTSILYEKVVPYLKSLRTYYLNEYCEPAILMVIFVSNAAQYVKIVPSSEFIDAIYNYLDDDLSIEDEQHEIELISFNSKFLEDLI